MSTRDAMERCERASEWFIELRETQHSPDVVASWLEWCSADPRNRQAFEDARRAWQATAGADERTLGLPAISPTGRPRSGMRLAIPITLAAAVLGFAVLIPGVMPRAERESILKTPAGINREVRLSDGSTVALGGSSRVVATLDGQARRFDLSSGEAYFKVARDMRRPFVVTVGSVRVTALGTEFNVRAGADRIVVAVAQGLVQIDSTAPDGATQPRAPLRVGAGETVSLDTVDASMQLAHADPANMASWQRGRLEFVQESLDVVLESVNRYSARRITLADGSLAELRFTGTVFTGRLDDWISGLPEIFPVTVNADGGDIAIAPVPPR